MHTHSPLVAPLPPTTAPTTHTPSLPPPPHTHTDEVLPKRLAETKKFAGQRVVQLEFGGQHAAALCLPRGGGGGAAAAPAADAAAAEGGEEEEEGGDEEGEEGEEEGGEEEADAGDE